MSVGRRALLSTVLATLALLRAAPAGAQPIVHVGEIGGLCSTFASGTSGIFGITLTGGAAAGQRAILSLGTSADVNVGSIGDTTGANAWSFDVTFSTAAPSFVVSSQITVPLAAGMTVLVPYNNLTPSSQTICGVVSVFSGLSAVSPPLYLDGQGTATGNSTAPTATTPVTTQSNDLVLGVLTGLTAGPSAGVTISAGSGFTLAATTPCSPTQLCVYPEYRIASATGTQTADESVSTGIPWEMIAVTYKGVSAPVELQRIRAD